MVWALSVSFRYKKDLRVDGESFYSFFPNFPSHLGSNSSIYGERLVSYLSERLHRHHSLHKESIREVLYSLFSRLRPSDNYIVGQSRLWVQGDLEDQLRMDLDSGSYDGLRRARTSFVVLAYLAHTTYSALLSNALHLFIHSNMHEIIHKERRNELRQEWEPAFRKLQGLMDDHTYDSLSHALSQSAHREHGDFGGWGRRQYRSSGYPGYDDLPHQTKRDGYGGTQMVGMQTKLNPRGLMNWQNNSYDNSSYGGSDGYSSNSGQQQLGYRVNNLERDVAMMKGYRNDSW